MVVLRQGDYVWLESDSGGMVIGAEVKLSDTGQILLLDDEGKEHWISRKKQDSIRPMHPTSVGGVDDMIRLGDLNEAGILRNLMIRYKDSFIYTYTGSILVAVNPYQLLPLYTAEQVRLYTNKRLGELPPHVFAIADGCYFNMRRHRRDQCCIISGESGAGKTESTKLILQFLAAVSGQHSWIEQQILEANPILEAFGNAKTIRNDNSSRFGKYIDIYFNKNGTIEGARIEQYLLEKSRVCRQAAEERNYHIFYCMLMGMNAEEKKILSLRTAAEYNFLTMGNCTSCEGRDDTKEYVHICSAMKILMFSDNEKWEILKLLAAMLHLGNLDFEATVKNNLDSCDVISSTHLTMASKLLEVDPKELEDGLIHRSIATREGTVSTPLSLKQAMDSRDAFAKGIYGRMFVWIVDKINNAIYKPPSNNPRNIRRSIGLLDIFGFENFKTNSFEQLCINFANEQLQQFFVKHVFKLEQEEYARENIGWQHIDFSDNQRALDVLACKRLNIIALIEEESHFPKGTDATMLNKMNQVHSKTNIYLPPKSTHDTQFGIRHFAGVVYYDAKGFLQKNRDTLNSDIIKLVERSSNKFLKKIFQGDMETIPSITSNARVITANGSLKINENRKRSPTLSVQFRQSLDSLMKTLTVCQPYFIRCIKPNDFKKPLIFDRDLCLRQLRYSGMMETIRIRKAGYPIRYTFEEFLDRYRVLLPSAVCDPKLIKEDPEQCCGFISEAIIGQEGDWKIGKTKIFLKDYHDMVLEVARDKALNEKAILIQRVLRGYKHRKTFVKQRKAAVVLQSAWRAYKCRKLYRVVQLGFARLQAQCRSRQLFHRYQKTRAMVVLLQARCRGYLLRQEKRKKLEAVHILQAYTRGMLGRRAAAILRNEKDLSAQEQRAQELERLRQKEAAMRNRVASSPSESMSDQEMVDNIFGFLPSMVGGQEGQAPLGFEDLEGSKSVLEEVDLDEIPIIMAQEEEEEEYDDLEKYSFTKFAIMYFQGSATDTYIRRRLRHPLLYHEDEGDIVASLAVWWIILRFMGDIPEPRLNTRGQEETEETEIEQNLGRRQGRRLSNLAGLEQKLLKRKKPNKAGGGGTHKRLSKVVEEEPKPRSRDSENVFTGEGPMLDKPMTPLEKLHFIVGNSIRRPNIRDEIYCQICKQLSDNGSRTSYIKGWILLSICLGIFPPSERFKKYLLNFIRNGPIGYSAYCVDRLRRTLSNGVRGEPPSWLELQATKTKKPIVVSVTLMDGHSLSVLLDSASTAEEICRYIAQKIGLKDIFGFSIYIALYEKVWSLGGGKEHLLDSISQCEQVVKGQGGKEQHAPWRLYFRKEVFSPWHNCSEDPVSTDLIYKQIIRGLKFGEYHCDKEHDLIQLTVQHYYIQFNLQLSGENSRKVVQDCITYSLLEEKSESKWVQLINGSCATTSYLQRRPHQNIVKGEVVDFARFKWPLLFSRFFEVTKFSGPSLARNQFIVAVNWSGISFLDEKEKKLLDLSYPEVVAINTSRADKTFGQTISMSTLRGEEFVLTSANAADISELVVMFLEGLKKRSEYAVALQESGKQVDSTFLNYKKGDLIVVLKDENFASDRGWIKGQNERTGQSGAVAYDAIFILPTLTRPSNEVLTLLSLTPEQRKSIVQSTQKDVVTSEPRVAPYSLKEFSYEHFRSNAKDNLNKALLNKGITKERLWVSSREPIKQPLLKKLVGDAELSHQACLTFIAILKYMGDYPTKQVRSPMELTDQIFEPAMQAEALRDEVYCQIMKQLTSNHNRYSLESGWQLMWLCCGLFPPSSVLLKPTQRFLESRRREPLANDCLQRIQMVLRMGPRKFPPHKVEVDGIQQTSTQIFHKVHFPNDTEEIFEVASSTRIRDLCQTIAMKLKLTSAEGFSLFLKTPDKVLSLNEGDFFFDSLRQIIDWTKKLKKVKEAVQMNVPYTVYFMRKLWFNVAPGRDIQADTIFHYPQELPKYLRGYHKCTKEDAISLAGLILKVKFNNDKSIFPMIPKILKDLVPSDMIKLMSPEEWKKNIIASFNKHSGKSADDAKLAFLKIIFHWPTFGCAFFEVKQTSEPNYPDIIMIAISKQGVTLIHPKTKDILATYLFNKIENWSSGGTYFHMTIDSFVKGNRILCETSLGYKMDDLLTSYVNLYMSAFNKQRNLELPNRRCRLEK
ncbi:unconventional myosin-VIIa [Polypterus senegalus]|uniref:unconventional myosin-VIIa n=1 Tax=Polypterus senegalus TaxID=55291 RepID=UPI0019646510|nr:unconventional myosin-VIIa [Polypterus senegalus]